MVNKPFVKTYCVPGTVLMCFAFFNSHNYYARHHCFIKMRLMELLSSPSHQESTTFSNPLLSLQWSNFWSKLSTGTPYWDYKWPRWHKSWRHFLMIKWLSSALPLGAHPFPHCFHDHSLFQNHLSDLFIPPYLSMPFFFCQFILKCWSSPRAYPPTSLIYIPSLNVLTAS